MGRLAHTGWAGVKRVRVDATDCPVARERLRKLKEVERLIAAGCGRTRAGSGRCRTWSASAGCASGTPGRARPSCMSCTTGSIRGWRWPQWNGLVERINRTVRTECWNHYQGEWNCRAMNERMDECIRFYNNERPHHSLGMKNPAETATMTGVSA